MTGFEGLTPQQIINLLLPSSIWDFLLYIILIFVLITLFMQPEGSITVTILLAIVVVAIFMDKVQALNALGQRHKCSFGTMGMRISFFVIPLLIAGITKNPKSRLPAIVAAVLGLGYTLFLWAIEMRNPAICRPLDRDISMIIDYLRLTLL